MVNVSFVQPPPYGGLLPLTVPPGTGLGTNASSSSSSSSSAISSVLQVVYNVSVEAGTTTTTTTTASSSFSNVTNEPTTLERICAGYQSVHGYVSVAVCVFGIISNVINIIVLTRKHMRSPTNLLLTALAMADILTMSTYPLFAIYLYILNLPTCYQVDPHPKSWMYFILFHYLFIITSHTIAMWLTVALAVFRYIFVCRHQVASTWCTMQRAKLTVLIVTIASVVAMVPYFFIYEVKDMDDTNAEGLVCRYWVVPSDFATAHPIYHKFTIWLYSVVMKILPSVLLAFLSGLLILAMQRAKKRRARLLNNISRVIDSDGSSEHNRTTMMMVAVVLCFILTDVPQGTLAWISSVDPDFEVIYFQIGDLMDIMVLINSAVNFILYCIMSQQFRNTFKSLFACKCKQIPMLFQRVKNKQETNGGSQYSVVKTETTHV